MGPGSPGGPGSHANPVRHSAHPRSSPPLPPSAAGPGRADPRLVRERPGVGDRARNTGTTYRGPALRRPGRARRGRIRGPAAPGTRQGARGRARAADVAAGGRGQRGGAAGRPAVAGVGRPAAGHHGDRRGRDDRGAPAARTAGGGSTGPGRGRTRTKPVGTGRQEAGRACAGGRRVAAAPGAGCEVEASLPTVSALSALPTPGATGGAPNLVRLVDTVATECHRVRLRRAGAQPLAFS